MDTVEHEAIILAIINNVIERRMFQGWNLQRAWKRERTGGLILTQYLQRRGPPTGADWGTLRKQHIMRQG